MAFDKDRTLRIESLPLLNVSIKKISDNCLIKVSVWINSLLGSCNMFYFVAKYIGYRYLINSFLYESIFFQ